MQLIAPEQQNDKTSAVKDMLTLADEQLIKCISLAAQGCYLPS